MNRLMCIICMSLLALTSQAQQGKYTVSFTPIGGYEWNILKAPESFENEDGRQTRNQLWNNAPFVGIGVNLKTTSKTDRHSFRLGGSYRSAINGQSEVKSTLIDAGLQYKFDNQKKFRNTLGLSFRDLGKTGEDLDNLLGAPLSYRRIILENSFGIKASRYWMIHLVPKSTLKLYERDGFDRFLYTDNRLQAQVGYRYHLKKKIGTYLSVEAGQRNHFITREAEIIEIDSLVEVEDIEDVEEDEKESGAIGEIEIPGERQDRIWRYYSGELGVKFPMGKRLKLLVSGGYTYRTDVLQDRLGYTQTAFGISLNYRYKRLSFSLGASHRGRKYSTLMLDFVSQETLRYDYIKANASIYYKIGKNWTIFARGKMTRRISNNNLLTKRAFRSYLIGEATIGVTYSLKGKFRKQRKMR